MQNSKYSAVVIGSGISGLYAALKLEQQLDLADGILLITKSTLKESNSYYAQGGMVAVLQDNKKDSVTSHVNDTLKAGAGLSDLNTVKFISENSNKVVKDLLNFGVEFDRDENGNFTLTKEAAHSVKRILHSGGDATGREMEMALCSAFKKNKNIKVYENTMALDLLVNNNKECGGVIIYNTKTEKYEIVYAKAVIIATGGLGQLYEYTTNPIGATGDGFALCYRAGAVLQDMEFVQFHPTALAIDDKENKNRFLISEAVRGEGAKLCDEDGARFMSKYDERQELAPRDIVARSIYTEMEQNKTKNVFLDATVLGKDRLQKRFPTIAKKCATYGIDITSDYIPVAPAAHYFMGGVKTNLKSETSIKNLYAIGEVACTGLHGGNRLASNSLLECVVCAYEVAEALKNSDLRFDVLPENENYSELIKHYEEPVEKIRSNIDKLRTELKYIMWKNVGIFRDKNKLEGAIEGLDKIWKKFGRNYKCFNACEYELRNMIITAKLVTFAAFKRKESRGAHYRTDYLKTDANGKHSLIVKKEGELYFVK